MVRPLLEITTTPARYEYEVVRAKLEISQERPVADRKVSRASSNMRRQAGRFDMNTVRRRSDLNAGSNNNNTAKTILAGSAARTGTTGTEYSNGVTVQQSTGYASSSGNVVNYSEYSNAMAARSAEGSSIVSGTVWGQSMQHSQGDLVLVPVSPVDIHYIPASLAGDFEFGSTSTNWNVGKARLDFVPGAFSLNFTQYASISIEYIGGFNYVPPSSDPDYEGTA